MDCFIKLIITPISATLNLNKVKAHILSLCSLYHFYVVLVSSYREKGPGWSTLFHISAHQLVVDICGLYAI